MIACNWLKTESISRQNARVYMDILHDHNEKIQAKKYSMFIPFYVWLDNICKIVKHSIGAWEEGFALAKV